MSPWLITFVTVRPQKSAWLPANTRRFGTTRKAMFFGPLLAFIALLALVPRWDPASVQAAGQQRSFQALGSMPGR
jgi:hypothetical protein